MANKLNSCDQCFGIKCNVSRDNKAEEVGYLLRGVLRLFKLSRILSLSFLYSSENLLYYFCEMSLTPSFLNQREALPKTFTSENIIKVYKILNKQCF